MKIIEVRDFSFRYANGSRESLSHVSLDVEEGTFNVLCGKSGCGKSTVLKLLMSLYTADAGEVYGCRRNMFAYVPQGNQLMSGSIRDIITFSDKDKSGDESDRIKT